MSASVSPSDFSKIQHFFLETANKLAEQLKDNESYSLLIYEINSREATTKNHYNHKYLFSNRGIRPYTRQCIFNTKDHKKTKKSIAILWKSAMSRLNDLAYRQVNDLQFYYDIAEAERFIQNPSKAELVYSELRGYLDSWQHLIKMAKSECNYTFFYFLDPEIAYKTTLAETEENLETVRNMLNEAKKVAEWYQSIDALLHILSYCKIAKSEIEIGHIQDAKETLSKAEKSEWLEVHGNKKEARLIADCCISALKIRIEPEKAFPISEAVIEAINRVDNVACQIIGITTFLDTLSAGHVFPNPIVIIPRNEMQQGD